MKRILIVGADRVMPKLFYFAQHLRAHDIGYTVYTHDSDHVARKYAYQAGSELEAGPPHKRSAVRMLRDLIGLWRLTNRKKFELAELYSDYHILASFSYFLVLKLRGIPTVLWCRGELYEWESFTFWQRWYFHWVIPRAKLVILKERYMRATLERAGVRLRSSILELHNTVPLPPVFQARECSAPIRLLFMNMFKGWRNVGFCADVAAELRRRAVPFSMEIVGEKTDAPALAAESRKLREKIEEYNLQNFVAVHEFSSEPIAHLEVAHVFLLPANLVFCNYSLLEAMSHGLVPLVNSSDIDYKRIVEHGVNGFGLPLDAHLWADAIQALVHDRDKAVAMSVAARQRIASDYSIEYAFARYSATLGLPARQPVVAEGAKH